MKVQTRTLLTPAPICGLIYNYDLRTHIKVLHVFNDKTANDSMIRSEELNIDNCLVGIWRIKKLK